MESVSILTWFPHVIGVSTCNQLILIDQSSCFHMESVFNLKNPMFAHVIHCFQIRPCFLMIVKGFLNACQLCLTHDAHAQPFPQDTLVFV